MGLICSKLITQQTYLHGKQKVEFNGKQNVTSSNAKTQRYGVAWALLWGFNKSIPVELRNYTMLGIELKTGRPCKAYTLNTLCSISPAPLVLCFLVILLQLHIVSKLEILWILHNFLLYVFW